MFGKNSDHKPISIIITTLAAQAYNNEPDLVQALVNIIQGLPRFIEYRDSGIWIPNPVNPLENFADRWAEEPERNEMFFNWLTAVQSDLTASLESRDVQQLTESLSSGFGEGLVRRGMSKLPTGAQIYTGNYSLSRMDESQFEVAHCQRPPWVFALAGDVRIGGKIKQGDDWMHFASDSKKPVPKKRKLSFKAFTNVSGPFDLFWQVVNTGEEARTVGGLRGEILPGSVTGKDAMTRKESTLYKGMHWVRCFVVKNGWCVARSAPFVVNIQ